MRPSILASASTLALGLILLFVPPFSLAKRITYLLDQRPERSVLFIGSARTFSNDMPETLLHIADSAGYANKLRMEMHGSGDQSTTFHGAIRRFTRCSPKVGTMLCCRRKATSRSTVRTGANGSDQPPI